MAGHVVPGEHDYDGIKYMAITGTKELDQIKEMPLRESDVILVSFSKAGSSWVSRIIQFILERDAELSKASHQQVPFIEITIPGSSQTNVERFKEMEGERFFSTHLFPHFYEKEMLSKRPNMIVLMRNPKDCLVSFYHFYRATGSLGKFVGSFDDFWEQLVVPEKLVFGDVIKYMSAWWQYKDEENFLFIKYEDFKHDPAANIRKLAKHLGITLTEERLEEIIEKTSFKTMSSDPLTNRLNAPKAQFDNSISKYFRKGVVGDWQNHFNSDQNAHMNKLIKEKLNDAGLYFDNE